MPSATASAPAARCPCATSRTPAAQVHCDSNTDPSCKSTEHTRMLTGYIQSMGYQFLVKPHAWATFIADRHSRNVAHPNRPVTTWSP